MTSLNYFKKQAGVTLVELMVGLSVGFIVVGGIITIYSNTAGSSASTIKGAILNQEMNSIMQLITSDLRRAGYWFDTNTTETSDANPFTNPDYEYNINIDTWDSDSDGSDEATSTCITYGYDLNQNSTVGISSLNTIGSRLFSDGSNIADNNNVEIFGFRYNTHEKNIEVRTGGSAGQSFNCTDGIWWDLNDPEVVTINSFSINTSGTSCINITIDATPNDWTTTGTTTAFCSDTTATNRAPNTITVAATDEVSEIRQINITLTGELTSDSSATKSLRHSIRVRNNRSISGPEYSAP